MKDEVTYETPDGALHTLFAELPAYQSPLSSPLPMSIVSQTSETDMVFRARVEITKHCPTCVVLLKHTYHPSWKATVNGKRATVIAVFPFYSAIRLETPGTYDIVFSYTPSGVKHMLFLGGSLGMIAGLFLFFAFSKKHS